MFLSKRFNNKNIRMEFNAFALNHPISVAVFIILARPTYQQNEQVRNCTPSRNCLTCYAGMPYHCTSCPTGFYLKRGGAYLSCERCPTTCMECGIMSCQRCQVGRYGTLCDYFCGKGCLNSVCDQHSGVCSCKKNFSGRLCSKCVDGKYGYESANCTKKCPINCKTCNSGKNCTLCQDGYYGPTCEKMVVS